MFNSVITIFSRTKTAGEVIANRNTNESTKATTGRSVAQAASCPEETKKG